MIAYGWKHKNSGICIAERELTDEELRCCKNSDNWGILDNQGTSWYPNRKQAIKAKMRELEKLISKLNEELKKAEK